MILTRYVILEVLKPLVLGVVLLVLIFTGYSSAVRLAEAAQGYLGLPVMARLVVLNTIIALEVLLPTALYLSIISALSRFYRDSEMAALQAAGAGEARLIRAIIMLALLIAVIAGAVSTFGRPWAYRQSYQLEAEARAEFDIRKIEPGHFLELQDSKYVLYANGVDRERGRLKEIFLQTELADKIQVIYAQEAFLPPVRFGEKRTFEFFDGYAYLLDRDGSRDTTLRYRELAIDIPLQERDTGYRRKAEATVALMNSDAPKDIAEFQWRVSTPLATLLLALLAVPLSRSAPRQGRAGSFFVAIIVYVAMFNLISVARNWVEEGRVGAFPGIWWVYLAPLLLLTALLAAPYWKRRTS